MGIMIISHMIFENHQYYIESTDLRVSTEYYYMMLPNNNKSYTTLTVILIYKLCYFLI